MDDELDAYLGVINRFIAYHGHKAVKVTSLNTAAAYPFVAMDTRQVFAQVSFLHGYLNLGATGEAENIRFLDVGCGIGNVLLVAEQYGFDVYGLEMDPYPCRLARELLGEDRVWLEDARSFTRYGDFAVVYFFRLFPDAFAQKALERVIEEQMRAGAILIANRRLGDSVEHDPRFTRIHPEYPIWRKGVL